MYTPIAKALENDPRAIAAEGILRKCVHCGFCLATCPTYNLLGDEQDSPRGRIYLIKQVVEGNEPTAETQLHLDRCLTCRNCETTCPSGVEYGHLVDLGRSLVEEKVERPIKHRLMRKAILQFLPYPKRMAPLVKLGQAISSVLPAKLKKSVPLKQQPGAWPTEQHQRTMLVLDGCVQPSMAPATNAAAARVLNALNVSLIAAPSAGCCGAVHFHLNEQADSHAFIKRNIDAWWPYIEAGAESVITTASGCGVMVKDYGHILADDPDYKDKAARVSALCKDIVEVLQNEDLTRFHTKAKAIGPIAFHPPCTLQHGQKLPQVTETLLAKLGFDLVPVPNSHTCCGSAGTYSIFQPKISEQLLKDKVEALNTHQPAIIATANIGCQLHLQGGTGQAVVHWVELLDKVSSENTV